MVKDEVLITFLKRTKNGEFASIEESSLPYARMKAKRIVYEEEDQYYYGIS
jgi:hypothetical protein